ncbi:hypothetical protein [Glutamicibacter sp. AOP5-A2-18]|uniref:hypothetical protein n=1 Tax=Glutamicibacter sp. AOP5-A2-18 TaxID=3457656 RepID=UPI0040348716
MSTPLNPEALNEQALFWAGHAVSLALEEMRTDDSLSKPKRIARRAITAYLAVAQPVVSSVEELDKLQVGSLIMMSGVVAPFLHTDDGWESTRTPGKRVWDYTNNPHYLPARVLYRPEES